MTNSSSALRKIAAIGIFLIMTLFAIYQTLWTPFSIYRDKQHVQTLPYEFSQVPIGAEVAVTGTLQDNDILTHNDYDVASEQFVAYREDEWFVWRTKGDDRGDWSTQKVVPALTVHSEGAVITVQPSLELNFERDVPQQREVLWVMPPESVRASDTYQYGDEKVELGIGSLRLVGLRNGDTVTAVGTKLDADTLGNIRHYEPVGWEGFLAGMHPDWRVSTGGVLFFLFGLLVAIMMWHWDNTQTWHYFASRYLQNLEDSGKAGKSDKKKRF